MSDFQPVSAPVYIDQHMYCDALLGAYARQAWGNKGYRRKAGGIGLSFSVSLIESAGGFKKFLEEWEEDPSW